MATATTESDGLKDEWIISPCDSYNSDYNDCLKTTSRIQQYYRLGEQVNCEFYKFLFEKCQKSRNHGDKSSLKDLVEYERFLVDDRKKNTEANDVWAKRDKPPHDWNAPLPDWCKERLQKTTWYESSKQK